MTTKKNPFQTIVQREEPRREDAPSKPKRGRRANGKRSNDEWVARTFYIKRETDLDLEERLLKFKRNGREMDKSDLIDELLEGWIRWHKGENIESCLDDISPMQKSDKH